MDCDPLYLIKLPFDLIAIPSAYIEHKLHYLYHSRERYQLDKEEYDYTPLDYISKKYPGYFV